METAAININKMILKSGMDYSTSQSPHQMVGEILKTLQTHCQDPYFKRDASTQSVATNW
jgi:hypothetical protein